MGNSAFPKASLKQAVAAGDLDHLKCILNKWEVTVRQEVGGPPTGSTRSSFHGNHYDTGECGFEGSEYEKHAKVFLLTQPLNKKGDPALTLAIRKGQFSITSFLLELGVPINMMNRENETALDLMLKNVLPEEWEIVPHQFSSNSGSYTTKLELPHTVTTFLRAGAKGASLHKLVLLLMKDSTKLGDLINLIPDLSSEEHYKLSGLFLQAAIWFEHEELLESLLNHGVNPDNFWLAPFVPTIVPSAAYSHTVDMLDAISNETEGEYVVENSDKTTGMDSSSSLQNLKMCVMEDWKYEWNDGENPLAQYRAGLLLTTEAAITLIQSANNYETLELVVHEIKQYPPLFCGGPNLKDLPLIAFLIKAGYSFRFADTVFLRIKYHVDFLEYYHYLERPKSLKQLARLCVRSSFPKNVFYSVSRLHCLPVELRDYLLLKDVISNSLEE